jgi:uncharacterized membrane protein (DUF373 family)
VSEQTKRPDEQEQAGEGDSHGAKTSSGRKQTQASVRQPKVQKAERSAEREDTIARVSAVVLHIAEDIIYVLTAIVLVGGAFLILGHAIFELVSKVEDGLTKAIEATMDSLLIVFILVELLSAVRSAIDEHFLVAEPFLLVGILAAIKEMVVLATFRIDESKPADVALKIGVLGAIVVALAVATLILRRREREPKESGDSTEADTA